MANNDWLEALHNYDVSPLKRMMDMQSRLNIALCYGCGKRYTRPEIAKEMWSGSYNGKRKTCYFYCPCGHEYIVKPYRPLTLWEIVALGKESGLGNGVNPAVLLRAMYEVLYG